MSRCYKPELRCPDCRQHRSICLCALLPRIETRTRVVLIIHQLEASKPSNTGVIAARCLPNSAIVYRGRAPGVHTGEGAGDFAAPLWRPGAQPLLLYPHPDATPLASWRDATAPLVLLVPDGTWRQAARTRSRLRAMATGDLPCVSLPDALASGSRLRASAEPGRLATLEAVALALGVLEGPAVEEPLLRLFRMMAERTLWTKGRFPRADVTGGIPEDARPHDPLGLAKA